MNAKSIFCMQYEYKVYLLLTTYVFKILFQTSTILPISTSSRKM